MLPLEPAMNESTTHKDATTTPHAEDLSIVQFSDGAKTEVRTLSCADASAPVIMILPALGVPARFYGRLAAALAEAGCHAVLHDLRGVGKSDQRAGRHCDFGYETLALSDLPAVMAHVQRLLPLAPIVLLGHSLGGQLALLNLALTKDSPVRGVALVASGTPYAQAYPKKNRHQLSIAGHLFPLLARLVGYYPGTLFGFGGREARRLISQWATLVKTGRFDGVCANGVEAEQALLRIDRPILAVTLAGDRLAPRESMEALLQKVPRAPIERWYYEPAPGSAEADHLRWAKHCPTIVARVTAFARGLRRPDSTS